MEEGEEGPPGQLEEGELRGPMEDFPRASDLRARPLVQRLLQGLRARRQQIIQVYPREGVSLRADEVLERGLQLAAGLQALGLRPGDSVTLVCARHPDYGPLLLATLLAGATWAPLNHTFDHKDLHLLLGILQPRVVLAEPPVARRLQPILQQLKDEGALGAETRLVTLCEGEEWEELSRARAEAERPPLPPPPADPKEAVAVISCSSGTTGLPKCVISTHFTLLCALGVFMHPDTVDGIESTVLFTSPGFWVTGTWLTLLTILHTTVLIYGYDSTEQELLETIERYRPPALFLANNFLLSVAKVHDASSPRRDISSVRYVLTGGAAMSPQADEFVTRVIGRPVHNMYGLTELNAVIGSSKRTKMKTGSVGRLSRHLRCKVVDVDTGLALGPNAEGELRFKGPSITSGYLRNPQATAELFDERGWLRTGDLGLYDPEGDFWVTGRIKDTLKFRGVHVSPVDVEGVLEAHAAVLESAVVGVPDPLDGELPRAYVVLRAGATASEEELQRLVREQMAPHKWLRGGVVFVAALPKTPTGKISRHEIRKRYVLPNLPKETF